MAQGDPIACSECRAKLDALPISGRPDANASPAPWRCYACRGTKRARRPAWGDWTCERCGANVAGPELTERPSRRVRRYGPVELGAVPRVVWGQARGYLAVYDAAADVWHEIAYGDAPAPWQAAVRRRHHRREGR